VENYLENYLNLKREVVGIHFFLDANAYAKAGVDAFKGRASYCFMVKAASEGKHFKAAIEHVNCSGGAPAIGLEKEPEAMKNGVSPYAMTGLYCDIGTGALAHANTRYMDAFTRGFEAGPLREVKNADVVIVIDNTYNAMRIIQGYSYYNGVKTDFRLAGNQAICSECTATPYITQDINVSFLCSGTRFYCKWDSDDVAIGFPIKLYDQIVEGVKNTLNSTESDQNKEKLKSLNKAQDINMAMKGAYYYNLK
jgi:uncharacterized protein (DUF169 family)